MLLHYNILNPDNVSLVHLQFSFVFYYMDIFHITLEYLDADVA